MALNGNKVCGQVTSTWLGGQAVLMHANASERWASQLISTLGLLLPM
jgi:hypothetical protein